MITKNEAIAKIYYNPEDGYGSISRTFKDAKVYNNEITLDDVKTWFSKKSWKENTTKGLY